VKKRWAVLFDLDGVLVRTEHLKAQAHSEAVKHFGGKEIALSFYAEVLGQSHEQVRAAYLQKGEIGVEPQQYTKTYRQIYAQLLRTGLEVADGVQSLLPRLIRSSYSLAVVSSSDAQTMTEILSQTGLLHFFDALVSADDVERKKPAPDAYRLALERLAISPNRALVIEDSAAGVQAADRAGIRALGVRHSYNMQHDLESAVCVLGSLSDDRRVARKIDELLRPKTPSPKLEKGESIMKTTVLIVEYLIAGILVMLALTLLIIGIFPDLSPQIEAMLGQHEALNAISLTLVIVVMAVAYGVGILAQYLCERLFEWRLEQIKLERLPRYLKDNCNNLDKSPLLKPYKQLESTGTDESPPQVETRLIGEMRFHVLMESEELYQEIESQLNRFRLTRVLVLVEVILATALTVLFLQDQSAVLIVLLALVIGLFVVNIFAVNHCFHRYCRATERAYKVLVLDA
jgi:HAD superfamily hydrolase (TIGR01509 family)